MRIAILQFIQSKCDQQLHAIFNSLAIEIIERPSIDELTEVDGFLVLDPILDEAILKALVAKLEGKFLLSLGQGAQTLLTTGLLPGVEGLTPCIKLSPRTHLYTHMRLKPLFGLNSFTQKIPKDHVAIIQDTSIQFDLPPGLALELLNLGLDIFHACDSQGFILDKVPLGLANKAGNVLALLPRMLDPLSLTKIFEGLLHPWNGHYAQPVQPLLYQLRT